MNMKKIIILIAIILLFNGAGNFAIGAQDKIPADTTKYAVIFGIVGAYGFFIFLANFERKAFIKEHGVYFRSIGCDIKTGSIFDPFLKNVILRYKDKDVIYYSVGDKMGRRTDTAHFKIKLEKYRSSLAPKVLNAEFLGKNYIVRGNMLSISLEEKQLPRSTEEAKALLDGLYNTSQRLDIESQSKGV